MNEYNRLPHSATGFAPETLHFGTNLPVGRTLDSIRQVAVSRSRSIQTLRKSRFDDSHRSSDFAIGELVVIRIPETHPSKVKFMPPWTGPYEIIARTGPETYRLRLSSLSKGPILPVELSSHSSRLRKYYARLLPPRESVQSNCRHSSLVNMALDRLHVSPETMDGKWPGGSEAARATLETR